ncbi:hypothetical protein ACOME3_006375 [Neoechinorhynchus agilis]
MKNKISLQDDFIFPRCNLCQKWGHWAQKCPSKKTVCAFCAADHHSSACPKSSRQCANCGSVGHCAFAKTYPTFKDYINWASRDSNKAIASRMHTAQQTSAAPYSFNLRPTVTLSAQTSNHIASSYSVDTKLEELSENIMSLVLKKDKLRNPRAGKETCSTF